MYGKLYTSCGMTGISDENTENVKKIAKKALTTWGERDIIYLYLREGQKETNVLVIETI